MLYRAYFSVPGFGNALAGQIDDKALWVNARADRAGACPWGLPWPVPGLGLALVWLRWDGAGE